ncbi:hypothetical protein VKT23_016367 [Stygiomarasmius scandens]|uniref:Uncharacterized protein n=1 Tax=Marasmiellus scandens TaxID=2682957 RepID=A0ABR1IUM8_9AGAR
MDSVLNGNCKHWSEWSTFLYDTNFHDPDEPSSGLFQSDLLVRVFNHIFNSSGVEKLMVTKGKPSVSQIHRMKSVTGRHIAYTAIQTYFLLSAVPQWSEVIHRFDLKEFYYGVVEYFEKKRRGSKQILTWWNTYVWPCTF